MKRIAFLFGSGISLYSGFDKVGTITTEVLTSKRYARSSDMFYYHYTQDVICQYVKSIQKILNYLDGRILKYQKRIKLDPFSNYENLYYVLIQIYESEIREYENPALFFLIRELEKEFSEDIESLYGSLSNLSREATTYIQHVVFNLLNKTITKHDQLDILLKIQELKTDYTFDIYSLNHDLLIEKFFEDKNLPLNIGFEKSKEIFVFQPDKFNDDSVFKLFKLHGSIDWFYYADNNNLSNIYKIPLNTGLIFDRYYKLDQRLQFCDINPRFLVGSFNKLNSYLGGFYEIFYDYLKSRIAEAETLIISGYGFGDKGINTRITQFLSSGEDKKVKIIHPNKDNLLKYARGSFHLHINSNPNTKIIEKGFEELCLEDINL